MNYYEQQEENQDLLHLRQAVHGMGKQPLASER